MQNSNSLSSKLAISLRPYVTYIILYLVWFFILNFVINKRGTEQNDGMTPLLDAACCGNLDVIKLLLDRGASPVMRTNKVYLS